MLRHRPHLALFIIALTFSGCGTHRSAEPNVAATEQARAAQGASAPAPLDDTEADLDVERSAAPEPASVGRAKAAKGEQQGAAIAAEELAVAPPAAAPQKLKSAERRSHAKPTAAPAAPALAAPVPLAQSPAPLDGAAMHGNTESYRHVADNPFLAVADQPLSTFSIDVDTASYSNVRRMLNEGQPVTEGAVRIEELVNYFSYDYPNPDSDVPFSVNSEVGQAPWNPAHQLVRIGLQGKRLSNRQLPPRNLVFLVDVSGSMQDENKLPLLKRSLASLTNTLNEADHVSIVVYAGASGLVLPPTPGHRKQAILDALERLEAGGSTNGASGLQLAYDVASRHFRAGGVNRVVLATDGDFNVGPSSESELVGLIEDKRASGVFLTVLGFGMGNYKDSNLEQLADHGNGNYAYIDTLQEANKVLVEQGGSTLVTIAKDVKIQVEFNPVRVGAYRLIGYENRKLENRDFNDDRKDAGEIGAGHSVTALYEIVPPEAVAQLPKVDVLKYQKPRTSSGHGDELMTVKLRYKLPQSDDSRLLSVPVRAGSHATPGSDDFRFAAAVAAFGMVLRDSEHRGRANYDLVENLARTALGADPSGRRRELLQLVDKARKLMPRGPSQPVAVAR